MVTKDKDGKIIETPEEATQGEYSSDTLIILLVSLVLVLIIGVGLLTYFNVLPWLL